MTHATEARWQRQVPAAVSAHDTMEQPDYADVFTAVARRTPEGSPVQWVHATFERRAPRWVRLIIGLAVVVQRTVLGMRIEAHRSAQHLLGWRIAATGENWVRLEAASPLMTGHLVLQHEGRDLSMATFVRYNRRLAAFVWPPVSRLHRLVGLLLIHHAASA